MGIENWKFKPIKFQAEIVPASTMMHYLCQSCERSSVIGCDDSSDRNLLLFACMNFPGGGENFEHVAWMSSLQGFNQNHLNLLEFSYTIVYAAVHTDGKGS